MAYLPFMFSAKAVTPSEASTARCSRSIASSWRFKIPLRVSVFLCEAAAPTVATRCCTCTGGCRPRQWFTVTPRPLHRLLATHSLHRLLATHPLHRLLATHSRHRLLATHPRHRLLATHSRHRLLRPRSNITRLGPMPACKASAGSYGITCCQDSRSQRWELADPPAPTYARCSSRTQCGRESTNCTSSPAAGCLRYSL